MAMKNPPPLIFPANLKASQGWGTPTDISNFQKSYGGLAVDGRVGPKTNAALASTKGVGLLPSTRTGSTAAGRMALRNDGFNTYIGDSAGQYASIMPSNQPAVQGLSNSAPYYGATGMDALTNKAKAYSNGVFGTEFGIGTNMNAIDSLTTNYTPEQLGEMDFSNYAPGEIGVDAPGLGMLGGLGTTGGIAQGLGAVANLANAYLGYKNYGLAKDKFGFETNRAIANQASEYNTGIQNAGEVGMGLAGNTMTANDRAMRQAQLEGQKISGSPL
jgi:hypothetical protein